MKNRYKKSPRLRIMLVDWDKAKQHPHEDIGMNDQSDYLWAKKADGLYYPIRKRTANEKNNS